MGLAPYGTPRFADTIFDELIDLKEDGSFKLNLRYFDYPVGLRMTNDRFAKLFGGPRRSPESARLILFASNTFLTDSALDLARRGLRTRYLNSVQLVENAVDWSLEDRDLLGIRGRAHFSRTLPSLNRPAQVFWEYLNYGLALIGLLLVWLIRRGVASRTRLRYEAVMNMGRA